MTISPVRTLFITQNPPYPPAAGAPLRNWQNISIMMKSGPVAIFVISIPPYESGHSTDPPPGATKWSIHLLSNGQLSLWEKIKRQLRQLWWYRGYPQPYKYYVSSIAQELDQVLAEFQPHVVVFEELWLYYYLPVVKRHQCRIIFDDHNVEAFLYRDTFKMRAKGLRGKLKTSIKVARLTSIERNFVHQANQVWVCSDQDAHLLQTLCGKVSHIRVIPNGVNIAYYDSVRLGQLSFPNKLEPVSATLIFTAKLNYLPNILAARFLLEQVYPLLKQLEPDCRLLLVGTSPIQEMQQAAEKDSRIIVTGRVPDIRPYLFAASVVIVPLLHGGGTRLKILEAFAAGRPVVSTTKGAEGLKVQDGEHLLIADSPEELAAGVCRLWSDPSLGKKLAFAAYELARTEYSWDKVSQKIEQASQELL